MQVFIPYKDILQVVQEMSCDKRRYNKQIVECNQILRAIKGETESWKNHPICNQYKNYIEWLEFYRDIFVIYRENNYELKSEKMNDFLLNKENIKSPPFLLNQDYLDSHKRRLYQKSPELYPQFKDFNIENDKSNLYCVTSDFKIPNREGVSILNVFLDENNGKISYILLKYK